MIPHMKSCFRRGLAALLVVAILPGCGNRETRDALRAAKVLEEQKQYKDADDVLVQALHNREELLRAKQPTATDQAGVDDLEKKIQADPEMLKMERAQIPIYLHLERPDLASAVYTDILAGDPSDGVVFDVLKDRDPLIRTGAVRVLGLAGQTQAIRPLGDATKDSDQDVRRAAVAALGAIKDPKVVPALLDALKDSYWFVRSDASDALGREHDPRAIRPLLGMIGDPDKTVQSSAENALVLLASTAGISGDDFVARLNDPSPKVVLVAAVCLAVQKDHRATPVLIKLANSTDADARLHAVKALGETGDASVLPTLRQLLHDPDVNVLGWTIIGLGKLNDVSSVPDLKTIAVDEKEPASIRGAAKAAVDHITGAPGPTTDAAPVGP